MTFSTGGINIILIAAGNWHLASGRFLLRVSCLSLNRFKNKSPIFTGFQANRQWLKASRKHLTFK